MSYLSVQDLTVRLSNGLPLLRRVSLDVAPGEVRALVGESGAGKAVLGILPRVAKLTSGSIFLDGENLEALSAKARRQRIGAQWQDRATYRRVVSGAAGGGRQQHAVTDQFLDLHRAVDQHPYVRRLVGLPEQ